MYSGRVLVSAVDEEGKFQVDVLNYGDIWYFPKGQAHTIQGLDEENEYLLVFDDGDFDRVGFDNPSLSYMRTLTELAQLSTSTTGSPKHLNPF